MTKSFKDLVFPPSREYSSSSKHLPLEFFDSVFPISKTVDIWLGYFTTNSFRILALPIAEFIHNGGKLRIVACHFLNTEDYKLLFENEKESLINIYDTVEKLKSSLDSEGQHFFDCLKYLLKNNKLEIKLVKFNDKLSHDKKMLFYDGENYISTIGSLNFTVPGIIWNGESFQVNIDWGPKHESFRIDEYKNDFEKILSDDHKDYNKVDKSMVKLIDEVGEDSQLKDLFVKSFEIKNKTNSKKYDEIYYKRRLRLSKIKLDDKIPSFPYPEPRQYQITAYENWLKNGKKGLFAMATGTGKTLTALNILLNEYLKNGSYRAIIIVPTEALVSQWTRECRDFNFSNIFSSNDKEWRNKLKEKNYYLKDKKDLSYIFISTKDAFIYKTSLPITNNISDDELILIVDEAHGIGTKNTFSKMPKQFEKRIGLSATPDRKSDDYGNNALNDFFSSSPPHYTFNYSLMRAINDGFLTPYKYYPRFVKLTEDESEDYAKISKKLLMHYDFKNENYRDSAKHLLIIRKDIINKASNKLLMLKNIISEIKSKSGEIKHTVVFVPEGYEKGDKLQDEHLINKYTKTLSIELGIKARQFGKFKRDMFINLFRNGKIEVLTAMKMLDEGVDIPEIKRAIFCSSTGNPRQYIQRRGRILRKPKLKGFDKEFAEVYDMIIYPNKPGFWDFLPYDQSQKMIKMEKNIFKNEMFRVINFLYPSISCSDLNQGKEEFIPLINLCNELKIDIFKHIKLLKESDGI